MAADNNAVGVDNTFRRKFDREEYLERAREREKEEEKGWAKSKCCYPDSSFKPTDQRALGMSMRVERASLDQVRERFEVLEKRKVPGSFSEQGAQWMMENDVFAVFAS